MMAIKEEMNTNRKTAITVGILFIAATVASSLSFIILEPILDALDYLISVSANESQVIMAALLMLIDVVAVVGIAIMMYPILKKHHEAIALGYVAARIIEGVFFIVYLVPVLLLLTLGQEFVKAGAPDASYFQTGGTLLLAASDWTLVLGLRLAFALSALILNYSLYQSKLIPRWLSGWGFVGGTLVFVLLLLRFFSINLTEIFDLPIALQEMVFAVWLIVKGFNPTAIASESAKQIQA
jgi:hypothetical protein